MLKLIILITLLLYGLLSAQIVVTSTDIIELIGNTSSVKEDTTGNISINIGSSGENQSWDFSNLLIEGPEFALKYIEPTGTPFSEDYPNSNFAAQAQIDYGDFQALVYNYWEVSSTNIYFLGLGIDSSGTKYTMSDNDTTPLPLTYGMEWTSREISSGEGFTFIDITSSKVDAWGKISTPAGTFDCLRIRDINQNITQFVLDNVIIFADTSSSYSYQWISKDQLIVAEAESYEDETNPNFSTAEYFSYLINTNPTSIENEIGNIFDNFKLNQNYPNPFNPETVFSFELQTPAQVDLSIYNIYGQKVASLVNSQLTGGTYQFIWNAENIASGIYYYRLTNGSEVISKKCTLLK